MSLSGLITSLNKTYGEGTVTDTNGTAVFRIPTGIFSLDAALGGGIGYGRFALFAGQYSGGKTLTALKTIANSQLIDRETHEKLERIDNEYLRQDGTTGQPMRTLYIDAEGSVTHRWASKVGVDTNPDLFVLVNSKSSEEAYNIARGVAPSGAIDIIVFDSLAAMSPNAELERATEEVQMAAGARVNNLGLRVLQALLNDSEKEHGRAPAVILVNHLREKIGTAYGNPTTYPGGEQQKYLASVILEFRASSKPLEVDGQSVGRTSTWKIAKNKLTGIYESGAFSVYIKPSGVYKTGDIDTLNQIITVAIRYGLIQSSGAWFTVNGERVQGKANVEKYLAGNPAYAEQLKAQLIEMVLEQG